MLLIGTNQIYFTQDGLIVETETYEDSEKIFVTNVWEATKYKDLVKKPEMGTIDYMEVTEESIRIYLKNVTEDDFKEYIKSIDDEYTIDLKTNKSSIIFYAEKDTSERVKIEVGARNNTAIIVYNF